MEGLKITEIFENEILLQRDFRIEADYWVQHDKINNTKLKGDEIISFAQYGTSDELNEINEGFPILRLNEFDSAFIGIPSKFCNKLSIEEFESLRLLKDDVLICRTNGNPKLVGKSAIVPENTDFAYASYLFKIRPKKEIISSQTLISFLNSKCGRKEIDKYSMTGNQTNFSPAKFREIDIPILSKSFQNKIDLLVDTAFVDLKKSKELYSQAETLLLETLNLKDFVPSTEKVNVKSFKDSFLITGRLDAEYYQKKYEEYQELIKTHKNGWEKLNIICNIKDRNFDPLDNENYNYIELADIGNTGDISGCTNAKGIELPTRARRKVNEGDVIISSIEGSLESCALITKKYDEALCSTGFYVINSGAINSQTLLVLFKSPLMQNILKQCSSGTILTAINKNEFQNISVPIIESSIQLQIKELIEESFRLKKESEELLELAKRMVEVTIEEGEERAMLEPILFSIKTEKPEIIAHLSISQELPSDLFDDVVSELNKQGIITIPILRENALFASATEWILPTAVVVGFVIKSYADGFLNEMGKEHYQVFKAGIKKIIRKLNGYESKIISTKPLHNNNDQSLVFSIETISKTGKRIKFLFNKDVPLTDWDTYIDSAVDLMEQHYNQDENELDRQIAKVEQPVSNPIFIKYNRQSLRWEVVDMQKMVRAEFEAQKKMKK